MKYIKGVSCPQRKTKTIYKGKNNPNWKGGRIKSSGGYIWKYKPDHPNASKVPPVGYVLEHRLIMEDKIGRLLKKGEVVHHINGKRDDNQQENLVLTMTGIHIEEHNSKRIWKEESKEKHRVKAKNMKRDKKGKFIKKWR